MAGERLVSDFSVRTYLDNEGGGRVELTGNHTGRTISQPVYGGLGAFQWTYAVLRGLCDLRAFVRPEDAVTLTSAGPRPEGEIDG